MPITRIILSILVFFSFSIRCVSQQSKFSSSDITDVELQQHIKYLSSDELGGRLSGTNGNVLAAEYIANEFKTYGLKPAGDNGSYFQNFSFVSSINEGPKHNLSIAKGENSILHFEYGKDYRTLSFSSDTSLTASLVFAGYGISSDSLGYDDYKNIDVHGKIVAVLRYSPAGQGNDNEFTKQTPLMVKAFTARTKGAVGIIFITGPVDDSDATLIPFKFPALSNSGIAAMTMTWKAFDTILKFFGQDVKTIQQKINSTKTSSSFQLSSDLFPLAASIETQVVKVHSKTANILAYLEGNDPSMKDQVLIIGAHMDHLGMGGEGSGSLKPDTIAIHHGADDNASGTAGLLEAAQYFSANKQGLRRTILFASFSGEELGLLGSDHYVKNPVFPLEKTIAMMNMDMIGRMKDSVLVIEGMGTSPKWEEIVKKENVDSSLHLKLKPDGFGPSDHASFYAKDIPVMFFFTNLHGDYHRPSDTWEKINYQGEQNIVSYVVRVASDIADVTEKPIFTKAQSTGMMAGGDRSGVRVSLGIMPDYSEDAPGLKITGTREGSAAEKAGLKGGDVITRFGGKEIKNIYDFMYLLGNYKPGDDVQIVVKRGTEEITLSAKLEGRK